MVRKQRVTRGGVRRPRMIFAAALPVAIPLLLAAARVEPDITTTHIAATMVAPALSYEQLAQPLSSELPEHSVVLTFEKNDTLAGVLDAGGLSRRDTAVLANAFGRSIDLRRLQPGHLVRFHYNVDREVDAVQMKVAGWGDLEAVRGIGGEFEVNVRPADVESVTSVVSATIDSSLYEALRGAGEGPQVVQQLVDVFQWDIDFFSLQKGDSFSFVVDKRYAGPDLIGYGPILAARFNHNGNTFEAFRHEMKDGRAGYYARQGTPLRKQ